VAAIDPWDVHLEAVTSRLDQMTSGRVRGHVALRQDSGWIVEFRGAGRSLTVQFGHPRGAAAMPNDYGRAVIYGCDYSPVGNEGQPSGFGKTMTLREGFRWDEQSIREVALEAIGVLRFLLEVPDATQVTFADATRQGPIAAAKSTVQRRKR